MWLFTEKSSLPDFFTVTEEELLPDFKHLLSNYKYLLTETVHFQSLGLH